MTNQGVIDLLHEFTESIRAQGAGAKLLDRGGINIIEVDLTSASVQSAELELKVPGYALRMLRHGSNPGARMQLKFGGNLASKSFAPGHCVKGGFSNAKVKLSPGSAQVGKATIAVLTEQQCDYTEDLIISAIGPVDLLGATDLTTGAPVSFVTVAEDTDPAGANPTGSFDGSGWELLRVMVDGQSAAANFTTADVVFWQTPSIGGTVWFECGTDGRYQIPDTDTTGGRYRSFTVGWAGRGQGYPAVRNLLAAARTGLGFIIQGLR